MMLHVPLRFVGPSCPEKCVSTLQITSLRTSTGCQRAAKENAPGDLSTSCRRHGVTQSSDLSHYLLLTICSGDHTRRTREVLEARSFTYVLTTCGGDILLKTCINHNMALTGQTPSIHLLQCTRTLPWD